jgi:hypothetical protein
MLLQKYGNILDGNVLLLKLALKWILKKQGVRVWATIICLRT